MEYLLTNHDLKTQEIYYQAILEGKKTFEIRKADRDYRVGDVLKLSEYNNKEKIYTGRYLKCIVNFMMIGEQFGIEKGYCLMSITVLPLSVRSV